MKVRGKKLTRKQKEALSAQGWDFRLYLCVRDGPDFMELVNRQVRHVPQVNLSTEKE